VYVEERYNTEKSSAKPDPWCIFLELLFTLPCPKHSGNLTPN